MVRATLISTTTQHCALRPPACLLIRIPYIHKIQMYVSVHVYHSSQLAHLHPALNSRKVTQPPCWLLPPPPPQRPLARSTAAADRGSLPRLHSATPPRQPTASMLPCTGRHARPLTCHTGAGETAAATKAAVRTGKHHKILSLYQSN